MLRLLLMLDSRSTAMKRDSIRLSAERAERPTDGGEEEHHSKPLVSRGLVKGFQKPSAVD